MDAHISSMKDLTDRGDMYVMLISSSSTLRSHCIKALEHVSTGESSKRGQTDVHLLSSPFAPECTPKLPPLTSATFEALPHARSSEVLRQKTTGPTFSVTTHRECGISDRSIRRRRVHKPSTGQSLLVKRQVCGIWTNQN